MISNHETRQIMLEGALNVRDLGGHPTSDGRTTKRGVMYRADALDKLTEKDVKTLIDLGLTLQIDLRTKNETIQSPSKLLQVESIAYSRISFLDHVHSSDYNNLPKSMAELYCDLLSQSQEKYGAVFKAMLNNPGACIFNCTAGKDRTGLVAMCLLLLAGVDDQTIIEDYAISELNLQAAIRMERQRNAQTGVLVPDYIFRSDPADMKQTLDYFHSKYPVVTPFFLDCSLTQDQIVLLKKRMLT